MWGAVGKSGIKWDSTYVRINVQRSVIAVPGNLHGRRCPFDRVQMCRDRSAISKLQPAIAPGLPVGVGGSGRRRGDVSVRGQVNVPGGVRAYHR